MPTPGLTKEEANRRIDLVEEKLKKGHPPRGITPPYGLLGAVRAAAADDGKPQGSAHAWYDAAVRATGREADWSMYEPDLSLEPCIPIKHDLNRATIQVNPRNGTIERYWLKTAKRQDELLSLISEAVRSAIDEPIKVPVPKAPRRVDTDIIPWFQIGDAHIGMLAHEAETGANFDLKIAERELCTAIAKLIDDAPAGERCVINDLGDATHYENMAAVTEASGHSLDADGRFPRMIRVYTRTMRFIVDRALERFKNVDVIINQGNHSRTNDIWAAIYLRDLYTHTKRVNVLDNANVFIPYRMGNTLVMVHHSDKAKPDKLFGVMANDFRQDWGETQFHYIDVGHLHHKQAVIEGKGAKLEMWNTLAPRDKWAHDGGWRSEQSITRVDRSKTYGEVGRRVLSIQEVHDVIEAASGEAYIPPARRSVYAV